MLETVHLERGNDPQASARNVRNPFAALCRWLEHLFHVPIGYEDEAGFHFGAQSISSTDKEANSRSVGIAQSVN